MKFAEEEYISTIGVMGNQMGKWDENDVDDDNDPKYLCKYYRWFSENINFPEKNTEQLIFFYQNIRIKVYFFVFSRI